MPNKQLKIVSAAIGRPTPVAKAARGVPERMQMSVEVENPSNKALHVWASRRAYDYDASTHVLTMYLTEHTPELPPGIKMISDHPRTPVQVVVNPKSRITLKVPVPPIIRRRVPGEGLGMSFVEEPIREIKRIDLHIQCATEPIRYHVGESPAEHRERLRAHGQVVRDKITPTTETKEKE
jgi:hypothetical protein